MSFTSPEKVRGGLVAATMSLVPVTHCTGGKVAPVQLTQSWLHQRDKNLHCAARVPHVRSFPALCGS